MVYKWKAYQFPVPAQVAGEELERIGESSGGLTPSLVVESAKPDDSVLHKCFEWNDEIAGNKWRETQASQMIRMLVIKNPTDNPQKENVLVRAFVNITSREDERVFIPTVQAMEDDDYRGQVLKQAINELVAFQNKYKELTELAEVFSAIATVVQ